MALTNVWCRNKEGEWVHTTANAADRDFDYSVSASSGQFRCYYCFHYVSFVKSNGERISFFRHNPGDNDKDCIERSEVANSYYTSSTNTDPNLVRLILDNNCQPRLQIGFFPLSENELNTLMSHSARLVIKDGISADQYIIDRSRFDAHSTSWITIPFSWCDRYSVSIVNGTLPQKWATHSRIEFAGSLFDGVTGRILPLRSDAIVGHPYFLVCSKYKYFYDIQGTDIQLERIPYENPSWAVYRLKAISFNDAAADFFFDRLQLRLTNHPSDIIPVWPPLLETEDTLDTNKRMIYVISKGESELEAYPRHTKFIRNRLSISDNMHLVKLANTGALQMVCTERASHALKCLYIRPMDAELLVPEQPVVEIFDDNNNPITDELLEKLPPRSLLSVRTNCDGTITVHSSNTLVATIPIQAAEPTRILDLTYGQKITVTIGLDTIRTIEIRPIKKHEVSNLSLPWYGELVPFPRRYAKVLNLIEPHSETYRKVLEALQKGFIPKASYNYLRSRLEESNK